MGYFETLCAGQFNFDYFATYTRLLTHQKTCLRTRTRLSTSSSKLWAKIPMRSTSERKCPPTWASSKSPMLNAWVSRCPHCVSFSMDAELTTTKLQRLWRWNKTTLLRSTKNKQEEVVIDENLTIVSQDNTKPQLTCIFFISPAFRNYRKE